MWKVGDKIKFVKTGISDSTEECGLKLNQNYKIIQKIKATYLSYLNQEGYKYQIEFFHVGKNSMKNWWIEPNSFELVRKPPTNEVEFLNAFQENFKEGV